jgi:hypothetical protein
MEKNILRRLNGCYYGVMVSAIVIATACYFAITKEWISLVSPMGEVGKGLQYAAYLMTIGLIPLALWWHKKNCKTLSTIEDQEQQGAAYEASARWRIVLIGLALNMDVLVYYLLGAYQPVLWAAGIAAIGLIFTKPTESKMYHELHPTEENY